MMERWRVVRRERTVWMAGVERRQGVGGAEGVVVLRRLSRCRAVRVGREVRAVKRVVRSVCR